MLTSPKRCYTIRSDSFNHQEGSWELHRSAQADVLTLCKHADNNHPHTSESSQNRHLADKTSFVPINRKQALVWPHGRVPHPPLEHRKAVPTTVLLQPLLLALLHITVRVSGKHKIRPRNVLTGLTDVLDRMNLCRLPHVFRQVPDHNRPAGLR